MPVARMPNTTLNSMDGFGFERVPKYARNTAAAAMPPNWEMRIDAAGEALVPVAAVSRMPYTMDSANVHTPDTRNTLRKSCFESAPRACGTQAPLRGDYIRQSYTFKDKNYQNFLLLYYVFRILSPAAAPRGQPQRRAFGTGTKRLMEKESPK